MSRRRSTQTGATLGGLLLAFLALLIAVLLPDVSTTPTPQNPDGNFGGYIAPQTPPTNTPLPVVVDNPSLPAVITPTAPPPAGDQFPTWMTVFFTDPNPPDNIYKGVDQALLPLIDNATTRIDVASFDLNLPSFIDALIRAKARGVQVRVVLDEENGAYELDAEKSPTGQDINAIAMLENAGIPVVDGGRSNGLMHNKILLVDGLYLVTGSWNFSYNDTFRNNNNILVIVDQTLIANYQAKFNEMFEARVFGAKSQVGAQVQFFNIEGSNVANYFSPRDDVMEKLVALVNASTKSVKMYAFTFTHPDMANALVAAHQRGVSVQAIIEARGGYNGALPTLYCAGVPTYVDGNRYTMHHKVIIIDDRIVITGSFNFTKSADIANDENVLIIANSAVAELYLQELDRLLLTAKTPNTAEFACP